MLQWVWLQWPTKWPLVSHSFTPAETFLSHDCSSFFQGQGDWHKKAEKEKLKRWAGLGLGFKNNQKRCFWGFFCRQSPNFHFDCPGRVCEQVWVLLSTWVIWNMFPFVQLSQRTHSSQTVPQSLFMSRRCFPLLQIQVFCCKSSTFLRNTAKPWKSWYGAKWNNLGQFGTQ